MLYTLNALKITAVLAIMPALLALTFAPKAWTKQDTATTHTEPMLLAKR